MDTDVVSLISNHYQDWKYGYGKCHNRSLCDEFAPPSSLTADK